jgi:hypothetical protein
VDEGSPPAGALSRPEALAIRDIVTRLRAALSAADEATVEVTVRSAYDSFRRARVRTYVPILAERRARDMLGAPAGRRQRGTGE